MCASFFIGLLLSVATADEVSWGATATLSDEPSWQALLHVRGQRSLLEDQNFLLSLPSFSPQEELARTISALMNSDVDIRDEVLCNYPARYIWLAERLPDMPRVNLKERCTEFAKFLNGVPHETIHFVFASANVTRPASMMGHGFLMFSGENSKGLRKEHAISFFTDIDGINYPKTFFDAMVTGKQGFFALSPYAQKLHQYLVSEQRNIWEYRLSLSQEERLRLMAHVWELKQVDHRYYFHRYNCATITLRILATVKPELAESPGTWVTPLDVLKRVRARKLDNSVRFIPSNRWKIRAYADRLPEQVPDTVKRSIDAGQPFLPSPQLTVDENFIASRLATAYIDYSQSRARLDGERANRLLESQRKAMPASFESLDIDVSGYGLPEQMPQDSYFRYGLAIDDHTDQLLLGYLPASGELIDSFDLSQVSRALGLGDITIALQDQGPLVALRELQVYEVASLLPYDSLTGGFSSSFRLGVEQHLDEDLKDHTAANMTIGRGLALALGDRGLAFGMLEIGAGTGGDSSYLYAAPHLGMVLRRGRRTKTIASATLFLNRVESGSLISQARIEHLHFLASDTGLQLNLTHTLGEGEKRSRVEILLKRFF